MINPVLRSSPPESRSKPCTVRTTPVPAARAGAWALWLATNRDHGDGSCPAGCSATARDGPGPPGRSACSTAAPWLAVASSTVLCRRVAPYAGDLDSDSASARVRAGRAGPRARGAATTGSAGTTGSQGERTCRRTRPPDPRDLSRGCLSAPACRVRACHVNALPRSLAALQVDRASFEPGCGLVSGFIGWLASSARTHVGWGDGVSPDRFGIPGLGTRRTTVHPRAARRRRAWIGVLMLV